jgi:HK97 family phage portal protein
MWEGSTFTGMDDPALLEYIKADKGGASPAALFNTSVFRCVSLISMTMGSLPFRPMRKLPGGELEEDEGHPLFEVFNGRANAWQSGPELRQWLQMRAMVDGNAFAEIVRSRGRVFSILPRDDIRISNQSGRPVLYGKSGPVDPADILHIRGMSWDGISGLSLVSQAAKAVSISSAAEEGARAMFMGGIDPGGSITIPRALSAESRSILEAGLKREHGGASKTGKWLVLDQGMEARPWQVSAKNSQLIERSKHQVEEIARVFGVPRPLMIMDDTSWGSGIEQLAILYVRFTLAPWFQIWERRCELALLTPAERREYRMDFDERELLRGSMKDQADFFGKALGGPGANGWMTANEVRELSGLGRRDDGDGLSSAQPSEDIQ